VTGGVQRSNLGVGERGQASLLVLGLLAACTLVLFGFGQALGARGKHQRAADLAAVSAAQVMSRNYSRLFELAVFENGLPNPRHLIAMTRRSPPLCLIRRRLVYVAARLRSSGVWNCPHAAGPPGSPGSPGPSPPR
jgi:hypothetical protein